MYKIDYTYLEDCDGNYSKAMDKIETVEKYMNAVGEKLTVDVVLATILPILGIDFVDEKEVNNDKQK